MPEHDATGEDLQRLGAEAIVLLNGLARAVSLYEVNNTAITRLLDKLEALVAEALPRSGGQGLSLHILEEEFFVNGRLLKMDARLYERATQLSRVLARYGVGSLHFQEGCGRESLTAFVRDLSRSVRGQENRLQAGGYGPLALGQASGRPAPRRVHLGWACRL